MTGEQPRRVGGVARRHDRRDLVSRGAGLGRDYASHPTVAQQSELHCDLEQVTERAPKDPARRGSHHELSGARPGAESGLLETRPLSAGQPWPAAARGRARNVELEAHVERETLPGDRKSTRLNSSHTVIS